MECFNATLSDGTHLVLEAIKSSTAQDSPRHPSPIEAYPFPRRMRYDVINATAKVLPSLPHTCLPRVRRTTIRRIKRDP